MEKENIIFLLLYKHLGKLGELDIEAVNVAFSQHLLVFPKVFWSSYNSIESRKHGFVQDMANTPESLGELQSTWVKFRRRISIFALAYRYKFAGIDRCKTSRC